MQAASPESTASSHQPARQVPLTWMSRLSRGAATKPPMAPAEYSTAKARDRRRTNHRASPAWDAKAAPVATPVSTNRPKHSMAPSPPVTTVAISRAPTMMKTLPRIRVLRTPKRLTLTATSGPGNPDMIMYTENMFPSISRCSPRAFAIAALMTAGGTVGGEAEVQEHDAPQRGEHGPTVETTFRHLSSP